MCTRFPLIALLAVLSIALLAGKGGDELRLPRGAKRATAKISAQSIRSVVAELGSDAYEGRGPGSAGDAKARAWLEARMKTLGFAPGAADGTYQQRFEMVGVSAQLPPAWAFRNVGGAEVTLRPREDFVATGEKQRERALVRDAEVVFVGYGIVAPEFGWNDYKSDVRGKLVLVLNNDPDWDDALFAGKRRLYYGRWDYKFEEAARHGAAAAIVVHTTDSAGYPWQVVRTSWSSEEYQLPIGPEPHNEVRGWVTEEKARELAALGGHDLSQLVERAKSREFAPVPLGVTTSLELPTRLRSVLTANVLALLRGRDPKLRSELVVYTAHHDHLGIGEPDASGDRIYNGALDNAAGVAVVTNIADAFAALPRPPRRSVLFAFVAAEEQGLLGSKFYSAHPTAPPGKLAANLNFDGANVLGRTDAVQVIGRGKSSLEDVLALAAARQGRAVTDETFPDRGFYYRSDQLNFARIGVPALFMRAGGIVIGKPPGYREGRTIEYERTRYHQPSDQLDDTWDFAGAVDDAQLGFWVGAAVAEADAMPAWRPGDEFEAKRSAALEATSD
jgi:Zn-dependent M28 family amino/carboxypeptidase